MPSIKQAAETMLNNVILPFWMRLKDEEHGGYYGLVDFDLQVDKTAEKGCILNSRILWFFSEAAILTGRADVAACARHAYEWFEAHCFDQEHGGVYWSCDYLGRPLDTTKHTYNQGFAIYALSAYYRLTGELRALTRALEIFRLIENRCTDAEGYLEAFTVDWQPESNEKLSENGVMAEKTMNTLLHVFEGYAGLYQASRDPSVGQAMRRILEIYADKIYSPELHRQLVFFDKHYHSIIDLYSYGHDIESSWLIDWGCALLGDAALTAKITAINSDLARSVYAHAYRDHSLLNECERGVDNTTRSGGSRPRRCWASSTNTRSRATPNTGTPPPASGTTSPKRFWTSAPAANGSGRWTPAACPPAASPSSSRGNARTTTGACVWN